MHIAIRTLMIAGLLGLADTAAATNLAETLADADAHDPQWQATRAGYEARREGLAQGRAGMLPSLVLTGEQFSNDATNNQPPGASSTYDSSRLALTLTQPLLRFDRWFAYQTARAARSQTDAELVQAEQDYLVRITETYLAVLRASEQLAFAHAEEAAVGRQLEQAQQRFNVGLIAITDVHETRAAYDLVNVSLIVADSELAVARARLETLTGKRYSTLAFPGDDMPAALPLPAGAEAWASKARAGNASLIAARFAASAAQQNARSATAGHLPNIDFVARRVDQETQAFGPTLDTSTDSVGVQFTWPLFAGGAINSKRKQAGYEYNAAHENLRAAELIAVEAARTQYRLLEADVLRVGARKQAIVSTQSALDATNAGHEVGTRNIVDVLQAQRNAFAARRDYANARYDYILDLLRLHRAAGSLSREAVIAHNQWLTSTRNLDAAPPSPTATSAPISAEAEAAP